MSAIKAVIEDIYEAASELEAAGTEWEQAKAQAVEAVNARYGMPTSAQLVEDLSGLLDSMRQECN